MTASQSAPAWARFCVQAGAGLFRVALFVSAVFATFALFSVIAPEWPTVRARLEARLARRLETA